MDRRRAAAELGLVLALAGTGLGLCLAFGWAVLFVLGSRDPRWLWAVPGLSAAFCGAFAFALDARAADLRARLLSALGRTAAAAAVAALLLVCGLAAINPHVTVLDLARHALRDAREDFADFAVEVRQARHRPPRAARVEGPALEVHGAADFPGPGGAGWARGERGGRTLFIDRAAGLVWGPVQDRDFASWLEADAREAVRVCSREEPPGTWRVPRVAEYMEAREHGALAAVGDFRRDYIALALVDENLLLGGAALLVPRANAPAGARRYALRCVARLASP